MSQVAPISLSELAAQQQTLVIPAPAGFVKIGTGFDSRYITSKNGLWTRTAFQNLDASILTAEINSSCATYRANNVSASSHTSEHLSMSLGVTVGCPVLSGNVTGTYDKNTVEDKNTSSMSRHCSFTAGRLMFETLPALSNAARATLQASDPAFQDSHGDYFVAGYELGADAGSSLSFDQSSFSEEERTSVTVTVTLLFWSASTSTEDFSSTSSFQLDMTLRGYDTLNNRCTNLLYGRGDNAYKFLQTANEYRDIADGLVKFVGRELDRQHLVDGSRLQVSSCERVWNSRLPVRLILYPYETLPQYAALRLQAERTIRV